MRLAARARPEGAAEIRVSDTAAGIAAEHLPRVLDGFFPADKTPSTAATGAGLGLAAVQPVLRQHGSGSARAARRVGVGTTITLTFPGRANPGGAGHGAVGAEPGVLPGLLSGRAAVGHRSPRGLLAVRAGVAPAAPQPPVNARMDPGLLGASRLARNAGGLGCGQCSKAAAPGLAEFDVAGTLADPVMTGLRGGTGARRSRATTMGTSKTRRRTGRAGRKCGRRWRRWERSS